MKENRKTISDFLKRACQAYFGVFLGDQDKHRNPHLVCKTWFEDLWQEDYKEISTSDEVQPLDNDADSEANLASPQRFNQQEPVQGGF